jgi:hypothetical protein
VGKLRDRSIEVHFSRGPSCLDPNWGLFDGIGLVTFDIENVLAGYGDKTPYSKSAQVGKRFKDTGRNVCLLTNMPDGERAGNIAADLNLPFVHKGMDVGIEDPLGKGMPSKSHPAMYQFAIDTVGFGDAGNNAAMVDDQLKNIRGAMKVPAFTKYFWTFPNGIKSHPVVALGRVIEVPTGLTILAYQRSLGASKAIVNLATGQTSEW